MGIEVVFFVFLMLPGQEPIKYSQPVESLPECVILMRDFISNPPHEVLINGGVVQAGCATHYPPSEEH